VCGWLKKNVSGGNRAIWIGQAGFQGRYQAQEDNRASILMAESIGLKHVVTYEHWRHDSAFT
jgi:hypothetical protein